MNTRLGVPSLILGEALEEFKRGIKGWLVPSIFVLLTIYMILVLLNADYMREMGAVGIQRNSAHLTYLMASGQSLWIFFTWAWVFAQVIMRDRTAIMHEVVYATPVSLRGLLVGRYLGALGLGIVMASAIFVGLIISPALASAGVFPKGAIGPIQWGSFLWAYLIFIIPTAAGSGALYLSATIKARDTKGAFICAALLSFIWMVGMIVLKSGDVNPWLASVIDPTAYAEAERQADSWTPAQKIGGYIELTPQLILNRLIWAGLPLFIFAFTLWKVTRESLVLEKAEKSDNKTLQPQMTSANSIGPLTKASSLIAWMRITLSESAWHTRLLLGGFGFKLAAVMLILTGALGSYVNFVQHVVGPKTAVPEGLMPFLTEFFYLILIFVMVGFLGLLFRRDEKQGFDEWVDTVPAPMGSIIIAKALSGILLIAMLCAIPALSSIFLTLLTQSDAFDVAYPFTYMFSVVFPSMLELGAFIFFLHALIRSPGLAYTVSIFVAFIAIVNHELMVVEYPPGQFAVPPHAEISNIAGWSTWLASLSWMALLKTSTALLLFSLAWLAWRRGTAATLLTRSQEFVKRLIGAPGIVACLGVLLMVISITTLSFRFIEEGDYESTGQTVAGNISWEQKWWSQAGRYTLSGGDVNINVSLENRSAEITWVLRQLALKDGALHATLPHGLSFTSGFINTLDNPLSNQGDEDHLVLVTDACPASAPCDATLKFALSLADWPHHDPLWLHESAMWLSADRVLPKLGHDRLRVETGPSDREKYGVQPSLPNAVPITSLAAIESVAPKGAWTWSVSLSELEQGWMLHDNGKIDGPLSFAAIWLDDAPESIQGQGTQIWHSSPRNLAAQMIRDSLPSLTQCVEQRLGQQSGLTDIVQVPRHMEEIALHNNTLFVPEDGIWEVKKGGFGQVEGLYRITQVLAKSIVLKSLELRQGKGAHYLAEGLAGWVALDCIETTMDSDAYVALKAHLAQEIIDSFSARFEPVEFVSTSLSSWVSDYAALSITNWAASQRLLSAADLLSQLNEANAKSDIKQALDKVVGIETATQMLGKPLSYEVNAIEGDPDAYEIVIWEWQLNNWVETEKRRLTNSTLTDVFTYPAFQRNIESLDPERYLENASSIVSVTD